MVTIDSFMGPFRFLSNFHVADDGYCVENHYQAAKATDPSERDAILTASLPRIARRMGQVGALRSCRPDWDAVRVDVMRECLSRKFSDPVLADALMATGDAELIEGNTWGDRFWGQCPVDSGENWLGRLLMEQRAKIKAERSVVGRERTAENQ